MWFYIIIATTVAICIFSQILEWPECVIKRHRKEEEMMVDVLERVEVSEC